MKWIMLVASLLILAALLIAGGAVILAARAQPAPTGPAYTVAQIIRLAADQPGLWNDRTVLVNGYTNPGLQSYVAAAPGAPVFILTDSYRTVALGAAPTLIVGIEPEPNRWLHWLRQVPGIRSLLPSLQRVVRGTRATYRVRLVVTTGPNPCTQQEACISASLLDGDSSLR